MPMVRRSPLPLVLLLAIALLASSCGGSESSSVTGGDSAATVAPAGSIAYIALDTNADSAQRTQLEQLLARFPDGDRLSTDVLDAVNEEGLDWKRDVEPALGDEVALVFLRGTSAQHAVATVALTQPDDEKKLDALVAKSDEPLVQREIDGWTAIAETKADLDAFERGRDDGSLADDDTFSTAMEDLPDAALAKVFVSGAGVAEAARRSEPGAASAAADRLEWASGAAEAVTNGVTMDGTAAASDASGLTTYTPTLLDRIPATAVVAASFHGSPKAIEGLQSQPGFEQLQLLRLLGVTVDQLGSLFAGEGAFWIRGGTQVPEVTLLTQVGDEAAARRTLRTLAERAAGFFGAHVAATATGGVVEARGLRLSYAVSDGLLAITTGRSAEAVLHAPAGPSLESAPAFERAKDAADLGTRTSGFLYVDLRKGAELIPSAAGLAGEPVPPAVDRNLGALGGFLAHAERDGDRVRFHAFLAVH
jgi:hypothetical protein